MVTRAGGRPTLTEIIGVLARSSSPTLIVEGTDDYVAFRQFEIENINHDFTVLPVHGKENVLELISRRGEINNEAIVFLVDNDCWLFTGPPATFIRPDIILTEGYSIENDLLRDGNVTRLLKAQEKTDFDRDIDAVGRFFYIAAWKHCENVSFLPLSLHPENILGAPGVLRLDVETQVSRVEGLLPPEFSAASADPFRFLRGKTLLALLVRYLSDSARVSKFSRHNLMELGAAARGANQQRIERHILEFMRPYF